MERAFNGPICTERDFDLHIFVPENLIDELGGVAKEEMLARGIEIAGRMIASLKKDAICDGVHIMAIGKEEVVPDILTAAGL